MVTSLLSSPVSHVSPITPLFCFNLTFKENAKGEEKLARNFNPGSALFHPWGCWSNANWHCSRVKSELLKLQFLGGQLEAAQSNFDCIKVIGKQIKLFWSWHEKGHSLVSTCHSKACIVTCKKIKTSCFSCVHRIVCITCTHVFSVSKALI